MVAASSVVVVVLLLLVDVVVVVATAGAAPFADGDCTRDSVPNVLLSRGFVVAVLVLLVFVAISVAVAAALIGIRCNIRQLVLLAVVRAQLYIAGIRLPHVPPTTAVVLVRSPIINLVDLWKTVMAR